jgi:hypothetical protein
MAGDPVRFGDIGPLTITDAMDVISAQRETSVLFAATIGRLFLKERPSPRRIIPA